MTEAPRAPMPPAEIKLSDEQYISADDWKKRKANDPAVLIDVRDQWEIDERGKIAHDSRINIPWHKVGDEFALSDDEFLKAYKVAKPALNAEIVIHCRQGRKASHSVKKLTDMKYENVKSLKGGYEQWSGVPQ